MSKGPLQEPGRRTPAKGVHVLLSGPNWVFLAVCTETATSDRMRSADLR